MSVVAFKEENRSILVSLAAVAVSTALIAVIFQKWGPKTDLQAYTLALAGLLIGTFATVRIYPLRKEFRGRILLTFTILLTAFWALEFFGGIAFFTLDKLVRYFQKS
jgi:hypothetical protein